MFTATVSPWTKLRMPACIAFVICANYAPVYAQTDPVPAYPAKPMRLVAPFVPGGSTDIIARILAQKLGEAWNQQMIVDHLVRAAGAGENTAGNRRQAQR